MIDAIRNAKIAGMQEALELDSKSYNWFLTIFYISYVVFEWLAFMWKVVPPHYWASATVLIWYVYCFPVPLLCISNFKLQGYRLDLSGGCSEQRRHDGSQVHYGCS